MALHGFVERFFITRKYYVTLKIMVGALHEKNNRPYKRSITKEKGRMSDSFAAWHLFMKKFLLPNIYETFYGYIIGRKNEGIMLTTWRFRKKKMNKLWTWKLESERRKVYYSEFYRYGKLKCKGESVWHYSLF